MDGAGRLARSLRSLRPQADLKAAAIGAAVLLREWLVAKRASVKLSKPAPAKARLQREPHPHRLIALLERYLPNRVGVAATALILLGSTGFGIVKGGHLEEVTTALGWSTDDRDRVGYAVNGVDEDHDIRRLRRRARAAPSRRGLKGHRQTTRGCLVRRNGER